MYDAFVTSVLIEINPIKSMTYDFVTKSAILLAALMATLLS